MKPGFSKPGNLLEISGVAFAGLWFRTLMDSPFRGPPHARHIDMELYYKDLISEDASLDKLVDDLMLLVQGATEFVEAAGSSLPPEPRQEITTLLQRLKANCARVKRQATNSALAVDKIVHQYPYTAIGFSFAAGLIIGNLLRRNR